MNQYFNEYDSSGPRPPIPGEETARNYKVRILLDFLFDQNHLIYSLT